MAVEAETSKWNLPGWRLQSRYNTQVLVGNWNEERRKFERGSNHYNSTNRTDFKNYGSFYPDATVRRKCVITNEGIGKDFIFSHHGKTYDKNTISWYDQQFNGREHTESKLPPLRQWDGKVLAYVPERSDYPIQGLPTNYGLYNKLKEEWTRESELKKHGSYTTTYRVSYLGSAPTLLPARKLKSTPQHLSSKLHPHQINNNLHLRGLQRNSAPERQPLTAP